jgi:predicted TIM-barrel fold metal-dependent hydrolase
MKRRIFIKNSLGVLVLLPFGNILPSCCGKEEYYSSEDFEKAPKTDAHFHYDTPNEQYVKYADSINMNIVSINVDAGEPLDFQFEISSALKMKYPERFDFLGTISIDNFGAADYVEGEIERVKKCMNAGAKGIKVWKNIGMALKDPDGKYVMIDDKTFAPLFSYMEKEGITLTAHLGEPRNCWLPSDEMTLDNDRSYYTRHPEYHMYQHPEAPSYEQQIEARDHILQKYPKLRFVGCHIGSMEWNLDMVAQHFDQYPNFYIDLAARIGHIQLHTLENKEKVRDFFIQYQDRILFGTDATMKSSIENTDEECKNLYEKWKQQWIFFATDIAQPPLGRFNTHIDTVEGLRLPKQVVDKIFFTNSKRLYA